jgi:hypothetical protein
VLGYSDIFTTGVHVDLSQTGPQDTNAGSDSVRGVENVDGTFKADSLIGDNGPNRLTGGGGTGDRLVGGLGDDDLQGSGPDVTVDYSKAPSGETIDLTAATATGGDGSGTLHNIANVIGSPFADVVIGNAEANNIDPGAGNDTVAALAGADTIGVRDGGPDTVGCGSEVDTVTADQRSVDQVNADCENVDFLPEPPTTTTGGGGTTGTGSTAPAGGGTATDRTLAFTLRAAHAQRVLRQKGLVLKVECPDEACTAIVGTTGSLKGLRSGIHPATKRITAGAVQTIEVRLTGAQLRTLRAALRARNRATLKVTVNAVDAAGNVVTRILRVKVKH